MTILFGLGALAAAAALNRARGLGSSDDGGGILTAAQAKTFGFWRDNPVTWAEADKAAEWLAENTRTPTAGFRLVPLWPDAITLALPGERNEHVKQVWRPESVEKIERLAASMRARGYDKDNPTMIWVKPDGRTVIAEGNHRVRAAAKAGVVFWTEISYLGGAETRAGWWSPANVVRTVEQVVRQHAKSGFSVSGVSARAVGLRRIRPGLYETTDGEWQIEQGGPENPSWKGEWLVTNTRHRDLVADPVPTFSEAKTVLAQMIAARAAGRI